MSSASQEQQVQLFCRMRTPRASPLDNTWILATSDRCIQSVAGRSGSSSVLCSGTGARSHWSRQTGLRGMPSCSRVSKLRYSITPSAGSHPYCLQDRLRTTVRLMPSPAERHMSFRVALSLPRLLGETFPIRVIFGWVEMEGDCDLGGWLPRPLRKRAAHNSKFSADHTSHASDCDDDGGDGCCGVVRMRCWRVSRGEVDPSSSSFH